MGKIKAYHGQNPYVFISYAHKNKDAVLPVIERLSRDGYCVWYDEGIDPGTEWDDFIADRLEKCNCVIAMISPEYVVSKNCCDEIKYARSKDKNILLIYLAPAELPKGMEMRLGNIQAVYKYTYDNEEQFFTKLEEAECLRLCQEKRKFFCQDDIYSSHREEKRERPTQVSPKETYLYISYAMEDHAVAEEIATYLDREGYVMRRGALRRGNSLTRDDICEMQEADHVICVVSMYYAYSWNCREMFDHIVKKGKRGFLIYPELCIVHETGQGEEILTHPMIYTNPLTSAYTAYGEYNLEERFWPIYLTQAKHHSASCAIQADSILPRYTEHGPSKTLGQTLTQMVSYAPAVTYHLILNEFGQNFQSVLPVLEGQLGVDLAQIGALIGNLPFTLLQTRDMEKVLRIHRVLVNLGAKTEITAFTGQQRDVKQKILAETTYRVVLEKYQGTVDDFIYWNYKGWMPTSVREEVRFLLDSLQGKYLCTRHGEPISLPWVARVVKSKTCPCDIVEELQAIGGVVTVIEEK